MSHECWPFTTVFHTCDSVSSSLLAGLQIAAAHCVWERKEGKRYQFGGVDTLLADAETCELLVAEIKAVCARAWDRAYGGEFWARFRVSCSNAHFLQYGSESNTPPPHFDVKASDNGLQVGNVIIYLTEPEAGGQTLLNVGACGGPPFSIAPQEGRMLAWLSYTPAGVLDPRALHSAAPVVSGGKLALCVSIYAPWHEDPD
jgi:hypothetical protein